MGGTTGARQFPGAAVVGLGVALAFGAHPVLEPCDFMLPPASITALIGPNGSGKSSLLNAIAGVLPLRAGRLDVLGAPAGATPRRVAYVLQTTAQNLALPVTAREVVTMARFAQRGLLGRLRAVDRRAVDEAMARLEVGRLGDRQLRELSGGQRQRVLVAQGLAQDAPLLLLDEPVTGLDLVSRQHILEAMRAERERGHTVIFSTHDLEDAEHADQVLLLAGRLVAAGPPGEAITAETLREAYSGRSLRPLPADHHSEPAATWH